MVLGRFSTPFGAPAVGLDIDRGAIKAVQVGGAVGAIRCSTSGIASSSRAP